MSFDFTQLDFIPDDEGLEAFEFFIFATSPSLMNPVMAATGLMPMIEDFVEDAWNEVEDIWDYLF